MCMVDEKSTGASLHSLLLNKIQLWEEIFKWTHVEKERRIEIYYRTKSMKCARDFKLESFCLLDFYFIFFFF